MANDHTPPSSDAEIESRSPGQGDGPPEARAGGLESGLRLKSAAEEPGGSAGDGHNVGTQELAARVDALEERLAADKGPHSRTGNSSPRTPEAPAPQYGDGEVERLRFHISTLSAKLIHTQQQLEELQSPSVRRRRDKRSSSKRSWWRPLVPR